MACSHTGMSTDRNLLAVIRQQADLTAPKSLSAQLIRDALREAMSARIPDPQPQPPVAAPKINVASPTSPLQSFLSTTKTSKKEESWKDPEVCNSILQCPL